VSVKPTAPDLGLQRLLDEGFQAEVHQQHLLVHSVPYLTKQGVVALGTLVCKYVENAGVILPPNAPGDNHQVWWVGEFPCRANGTYLTDLVADTQTQRFVVFDGCVAQHQFSNKPDIWNASGYPDHYEKMTHYVAVIESQARVVDGDADARTSALLSRVSKIQSFVMQIRLAFAPKSLPHQPV
jgi:hypothetical protein